MSPTILLCDDEADLREIFAFDLTEAGYTVLQANGGQEAWDLLQGQAVQAVVTDVRMPGGSGVELLKNIRAKLSSDLPVLFLTGGRDTDAHGYFKLGVHGVLCKPFDVHDLTADLVRFLSSRHERWRPGRSPRPAGLVQTLTSQEALPIAYGQGGMVLRVRKPTLLHGPVDFLIPLEGGPSTELAGTGVVRWLRSDENADLTAGVEIFSVANADFDKTLAFLEAHATKNYLPT